MKPHDYRDLIAAYIDANYARRGIIVYTEVALGKTIIGKNAHTGHREQPYRSIVITRFGAS